MSNSVATRNCHLYLFLWIISDIHAIIRSFDSISVLAMAACFCMGFYYMYKVNNLYKNSFIVSLNWLLLMFSIYGFFSIMLGDSLVVSHHDIHSISNRKYLINIYNSLLPIYPIFYFTKNGSLTIHDLKVYFFLVVALSIGMFFQQQAAAIELAGTDTRVTNNAGYLILALLPGFALFSDKRMIQYVGFMLVAVFILIAMKRGPILIYPVCLIYFLFICWKYSTGKTRFYIVFLGGLLLGALVYYVSYRYQTDMYFQYRMEQTREGNSSGRGMLYSYFLNYYVNEYNVLELLFGKGADSTLKVGINYAHNDWIEILMNQGFLGVLCYLVFWIQLFRVWIKSSKFNMETERLVIGVFCIYFFARTFISMGYSDLSFHAVVLFAFSLARVDTNENLIYNQ